MVVDDALQRAFGKIVRRLIEVGIVDDVDLAAGNRRDDFRSLEAEAFENEGRFRSRRPLSGRDDVEAALLIEIRAGNGGNNAVGIGVLMAENDGGHVGMPSDVLLGKSHAAEPEA